MKQITILFLFSLLVTMMAGCEKSKAEEGLGQEKPADAPRPFVVGYLFSSTDDLGAAFAGLDLKRITHLNIAFLNPAENGRYTTVNGLPQIVKQARDQQVKVLFSIGGGMPPPYLKDLLKPDKQAALINELVKFTVDNNFDGIDVDIENEFIDENYEPFVLGLSKALKPHKKLITSALSAWTGKAVSDKALAVYDIIHIMSYDQTGPWNKERPGPHSTFEAAQADLDYWIDTRKVPASKVTLGLPFYGYGFGPSIPESLSFGDIVRQWPGAELKDQVDVPGQGTVYYNGLPTISKKVELARSRRAAGVMIWQLRGDAPGAQSLLKAINEVLYD
ncbi:glycosyl hydrolase family 18 protein [Arcticibacter sp.]|jgi:GH18 family chitinase|uniref:glycosyl hydrolase family 18 protein n=1 Tax=Arcticibacter sp. TaxID=1872630 RepID=UPI003890B083